MIKIKIGKILFYEYFLGNSIIAPMPLLSITVAHPSDTNEEDGNDTNIATYYMSPFRDLNMQISETINGETKLADSEQFGLMKLYKVAALNWKDIGTTMPEIFSAVDGSAILPLIKSQISDCLMNFCFGFLSDSIEIEHKDMLDEFAKAVVIYLAIRSDEIDKLTNYDLCWFYDHICYDRRTGKRVHNNNWLSEVIESRLEKI